MTTEEQILEELKKINIYLAKKSKSDSLFSNFLKGFLKSLGNLIGIVLISLIFWYFISKIDWNQLIQQYIPKPSIQLGSQLFQQ